jgi:hypothetical protein
MRNSLSASVRPSSAELATSSSSQCVFPVFSKVVEAVELTQSFENVILEHLLYVPRSLLRVRATAAPAQETMQTFGGEDQDIPKEVQVGSRSPTMPAYADLAGTLVLPRPLTQIFAAAVIRAY